MVLEHCSKSHTQLPSILCVAFTNLSLTDSIWIRADDAYFVGEIYTSDVVESVTFETETWLKFRGEIEAWSKTPRRRPRLETWSSRPRLQNLCILPTFFWKTSLSLLSRIFFQFLAFFRRVLVVSYLKVQQTKNRWIIKILINHFFAIFKISRSETFEAETRKNGSRDRDQVSRLHHWYIPCKSLVSVWFFAGKGFLAIGSVLQ